MLLLRGAQAESLLRGGTGRLAAAWQPAALQPRLSRHRRGLPVCCWEGEFGVETAALHLEPHRVTSDVVVRIAAASD